MYLCIVIPVDYKLLVCVRSEACAGDVEIVEDAPAPVQAPQGNGREGNQQDRRTDDAGGSTQQGM